MSGLIDAAFMQFYQACELLCRDKDGRMKQSKKFIAKLEPKDSRDLQIIAHQVWRVRNKISGMVIWILTYKLIAILNHQY